MEMKCKRCGKQMPKSQVKAHRKEHQVEDFLIGCNSIVYFKSL